MTGHDEDEPARAGGRARPAPPDGGAAPSGIVEEPHLLRLYTEKVPGRGEDSEPIAMEVGPTAWAVAVLDGLGGAGATPMTTAGGTFSSAYVAARIARESVCATLSELASSWTPRPAARHADRWSHGDLLRERLTERIYADLRRCHDEVAGAASPLRGATIRPLPTTLALGLARDGGAGNVEIDALWAGDSRVYLVDPRTGLHQLSTDDLKSGGDAMQNLMSDGPMSNLLSADGRFSVNHVRYEVGAPVVLLAATDGCFGYLRTPAHFEALLLDAMQAVIPRPGERPAAVAALSDPWRAWRTELKARIAQVAADDATMSLTCIGWSDFGAMAADFAERAGTVGAAVDSVDRLAEERARVQRAAKLAEEQYEQARSGLWRTYRVEYERLLVAGVPTLIRAAPSPAHAPVPSPVPVPAPTATATATATEPDQRAEPHAPAAPAAPPGPRASEAEPRPKPPPATPGLPRGGTEEPSARPPEPAATTVPGCGDDDLTALSQAVTGPARPASHGRSGGAR